MFSDRVNSLLKVMSIEEKLGQMTQLQAKYFSYDSTKEITGPEQMLHLKKEDLKLIGSSLNSKSAKQNIKVLKRQVEEQPHHIPMMVMGDVIHGHATIFPIPLAIGASFNPELSKKVAEISALESAVSGVHLTFSPMADLVRDARWGRVMESYGEDSYLNSLMAKAAVEGYQGKDIKEFGKMASCVKHFAAYGASESGREYNTVDMSEGTLREYYLPAYKAAIDAGVKMVMSSFNVIDRIPASANHHLLKEILRDEWKFEGTIITDFATIEETIAHGYAKDRKEAAEKCLHAGCDIEMMSTNYFCNVKKLLDEEKISMKQIDNAVGKILTLKEELGLFENPLKDTSEELEKKLLLCEKHKSIARDISKKTIVLLENNGILPLSKKGLVIGVVGPFASTKRTFGAWSRTNDQSISFIEGIKAVAPENTTIVAMNSETDAMWQGFVDVPDVVSEAKETIKECDIIILAVGEDRKDSGEAASKTDLRLSKNQEKLVKEMATLNKPMVMVLFAGRPMEISDLLPYCDAVIQGWYLGNEMGNALADVVFGNYNPSARLPISYPRSVGQYPLYYNCYNTGRPNLGDNDKHMSRYIDCQHGPLYPFGYGLSYSTFEYSNLEVKIINGEIVATIMVKNSSEIDGIETVQCFIRDLYGSVVRPICELKDFKQLNIKAKETVKIVFRISKEKLHFYNNKLKFVFEPGEFEIMVGANSQSTLKEIIYYE